MKKFFDSFLVNAIVAMLVVLYMLYDEQRLYPGHPLIGDLAYGVFLSVAASLLAETAKILLLKRGCNWWHTAIGAVTGCVLAFGAGYLIYGAP